MRHIKYIKKYLNIQLSKEKYSINSTNKYLTTKILNRVGSNLRGQNRTSRMVNIPTIMNSSRYICFIFT